MSRQTLKIGFTLLFVAVAFVALIGLATTSTTQAAPPMVDCVPGGTVVCPPTPTATTKAGGPGGPGGGPSVGVTTTPTPSVSCTVNAGGTVCTLGTKSITVPDGAVPAGTTLTITGPLSQPPCPATSAGSLFLGDCFKTDWISAGGTALAPLTPFSKPVNDCLLYDGSQVALAGGSTDNLRIGFIYDPSTLAWTLVKPTVDAANSRVCTNATQVFFYQALFSPAPLLPVTGGAETSPMFGWLLAIVAVSLASIWGGKRFLHQ